MAINGEPILSRFNRLDIMMGYLEEIRGSSTRISGLSSPSSGTGTRTSDGGHSSVTSSPRSLEKRCRPMESVILETKLKGNLIERIMQLENRVLKMSLQVEEEIEGDRRKEEEEKREKKSPHSQKKGLKSFVKSCVKGSKHKNKG